MATNQKVDVRTVGPDVPFMLDIQTQEILDLSVKYLELKPVTNPINMERDGIPTDDGLFSTEIFGVTAEERKHKYGYINLNTKIIHPVIYGVLTSLQQNIDKCCAGEGCWEVTEKGDLIRLKDGDPKANPDHTGMDWFIKNLPKIKFHKNKSRQRTERIDLLNTFTQYEYIIDKWIVLPVYYRDVENTGGVKKTPKINKEYQNLIRYAKSLQDTSFAFISNNAKYNIQQTTIRIHNYFKEILEKSHGFFKQNVVGKNPDYGHRSVISCMLLDQYDTPDEVPIDTEHCGVPLAELCVTLYPFIVRWVTNYLTEMFETSGIRHYVRTNKGEVSFVELYEPMEDYQPDIIKKRIDKWIDNYETRFEPLNVRYKNDDGTIKTVPLVFLGRPYNIRHPEESVDTPISNRAFTWTDLLYIAACECSEDKHIWITRYPLVSYTGIFPCGIHVLSTIKTTPIKLKIRGTERLFPYYPVVEPDADPERISIAFNDTLNMDNSMLDSIGGDYDGDQVSHRALFSVEANEETDKIMKSKKHYLTCQGKMIEYLGNEAVLGLYSMTQFDPNRSHPAPDNAVAEILNTDYRDIGVTTLTRWFGVTADSASHKISPPTYRVYDTVKLEKGSYTNKTEVETTLGLLAFNKICIEPYIENVIPDGYWNKPIDSKGYKALFGLVANELKYDRITTDQVRTWLKAIQFYGYKSTTIFASSMTEASIVPDKKIIAEKEKFFKEHPNATITEVADLEDKLSAMLQEKIDKDSSRTLFASGAKAKVDDQLKNINTMIGPVYNPATGQFDVVKSSYVEGFKKEEIPMAANMVISASYPKAVGTATSGYITKQFYALYGGLTVGKDGTDCHTKSYLTLRYTEDNWRSLEGQNVMIDDEHYETVTDQNYKKFINKDIHVRSPMCCLGKEPCSVCIGRRPYELDMRSIGINFATVPNTFLNAGMKKFHTSRFRLSEVDGKKLFI